MSKMEETMNEVGKELVETAKKDRQMLRMQGVAWANENLTELEEIHRQVGGKGLLDHIRERILPPRLNTNCSDPATLEMELTAFFIWGYCLEKFEA